MTSPSRVALITGASAGIGKASAIALGRLGWRIIGVGRDPGRTASAQADIRAALPDDTRVDFLRADFDSMAEVKRLADEIAALTDRLDVLVNNAGGVRDARYVTPDGLEATFASNHLAPFLLTRELLPLMRQTAQDAPDDTAQDAPDGTVRIIAVSSEAHEYCPAMKWDDLQMEEDFATGAAYCQAKLANVLFTRELARRLEGENIVAQAMHPGKIASNFASHADSQMKRHYDALDCEPPETPARTIAWMATAPEAGRPGARYFFNMAEIEAAPQARDNEAAQRLWEESEAILARLGF